LYDGSTTENISTDDDINEHGDLKQGALLRTRFTPTAGTTGVDTGQVNIPGRESAVVRLQTYPIDITGGVVGDPDKTQFYVYDIYGRGYSIDVKDSGETVADWIINAGSFIIGREYTIVSLGNDLFDSGAFVIGTEYTIKSTGTTDFTLIGATNSDVDTIFTATGIGSGTGTAQRSPTDFTLIGAADSNVGTVFTATGIGTNYGTARGPIVTNIQPVKLDDASDTNKQLIAVEKPKLNDTNEVVGTDVEFMLYDKKDTSGMHVNISNRALYTGIGHDFVSGSVVHVLDTPLQIVLQDLV